MTITKYPQTFFLLELFSETIIFNRHFVPLTKCQSLQFWLQTQKMLTADWPQDQMCNDSWKWTVYFISWQQICWSVMLMHHSLHLEQIIIVGCFPYLNVTFTSGNMKQKIYRNKPCTLEANNKRVKTEVKIKRRIQ